MSDATMQMTSDADGERIDSDLIAFLARDAADRAAGRHLSDGQRESIAAMDRREESPQTAAQRDPDPEARGTRARHASWANLESLRGHPRRDQISTARAGRT